MADNFKASTFIHEKIKEFENTPGLGKPKGIGLAHGSLRKVVETGIVDNHFVTIGSPIKVTIDEVEMHYMDMIFHENEVIFWFEDENKKLKEKRFFLPNKEEIFYSKKKGMFTTEKEEVKIGG